MGTNYSKSQSGGASLNDLPPEILGMIVDDLPSLDKISLNAVNRYMARVVDFFPESEREMYEQQLEELYKQFRRYYSGNFYSSFLRHLQKKLGTLSRQNVMGWIYCLLRCIDYYSALKFERHGQAVYETTIAKEIVESVSKDMLRSIAIDYRKSRDLSGLQSYFLLKQVLIEYYGNTLPIQIWNAEDVSNMDYFGLPNPNV